MNFIYALLNNIKVSFHERVILDGVTLRINAGDKIALLGPSGEGKSTLLRVLMGLVEPLSGSVIINDMPLRSILNEWRGISFMLSQRSHLFRRSIRENLLMAKEDATEGDIEYALKFVGMWERVLQWGGIDKVAYEDFQPSGGEKSRLLLARGVLRNPQVLILDEPLEGVDKESEKEVVDRIKAFAKDKTLIVVSHRLSILAMADIFATLENGKITKVGKLEEHEKDSLLKKYISAEKQMTEKFWR
ncbi:MAG: ATP-binding cassette domain-containing protein [Dictyoglomi bacterium]|nr:ATP-binding cassette domain-containing protein [Dictyoglomota bacterium]